MDQKIGIAAFFHNFKSEPIDLLFEEYIIDNRFKNYSQDIKKNRNILVYLTFFQILSSIIGMLYIVIRRSFIYVFINLLTLLLSLCGIYGSIKIEVKFLIIHCILTISITSGFFMYQLFDLFFAEDTSYGDKRRINDNLILLIFSIPYLYDMITGIYNYIFIKKLSEIKIAEKDLLQEELEQVGNKYTDNDIDNHINKIDRNICVVCMDKDRNTVMNPCGHVLCCEDCSKHIFRNVPRCPICKKKLSNYTKLIIS